MREPSQRLPASVTVSASRGLRAQDRVDVGTAPGREQPGDELLAQERIRLALEGSGVQLLRLTPACSKSDEEAALFTLAASGDPGASHAARKCRRSGGRHDNNGVGHRGLKTVLRLDETKTILLYVRRQHERPRVPWQTPSTTREQRVDRALGPAGGDEVGAQHHGGGIGQELREGWA